MKNKNFPLKNRKFWQILTKKIDFYEKNFWPRKTKILTKNLNFEIKNFDNFWQKKNCLTLQDRNFDKKKIQIFLTLKKRKFGQILTKKIDFYVFILIFFKFFFLPLEELACDVMEPRRRRMLIFLPRRIVLLRPPWRMCSRVSRSRSIGACDWIEYCDWWESNEWRRDPDGVTTEILRTALTDVSESSELRRRPKAPAAPTMAPRRVTNLGMAAAHAELTSLDICSGNHRIRKVFYLSIIGSVEVETFF